MRTDTSRDWGWEGRGWLPTHSEDRAKLGQTLAEIWLGGVGEGGEGGDGSLHTVKTAPNENRC